MKKFLIHLFIFLMFAMPALSFATETKPWPGLVPCKNTPIRSSSTIDGKQVSTVTTPNPCDFIAFMTLINKLIDFIFKFLAVPIAAIMFFYAGFQLVTSGGSTEKRGTAKNVFTNAVIGLALAAGAWLIVKALLVGLGFTDLGVVFNL